MPAKNQALPVQPTIDPNESVESLFQALAVAIDQVKLIAPAIQKHRDAAMKANDHYRADKLSRLGLALGEFTHGVTAVRHSFNT
jgi:hypothetical protein